MSPIESSLLTSISAPYSSSHFHTAPSIRAAGLSLRARDAQSFIAITLAPLIKSHDMTAHFGVGLVHRHFDMTDNEILVDYNNTSTPWAVKPGRLGFNGGMNSLVFPVGWMLHDEKAAVAAEETSEEQQDEKKKQSKWMPYEFAFSPLAGRDSYIVDLDTPSHRAFIDAFTHALTAGGFHDLLGLRAWPGPGFKGTLEFTQGRANINLRPGEYELAEGSEEVGYTQTMWFYEQAFEDSACQCICSIGRHGGHVGHGGHYGTRGDVHGPLI